MKKSGTDNALKAARRMMKERGFVVAGFVAHAPRVCRGDVLIQWAGSLLPGDAVLYVTGRATRKDWDEQFAVLFPGHKDHNPVQCGMRFYRCELQDGTQAFSDRGGTVKDQARQ